MISDYGNSLIHESENDSHPNNESDLRHPTKEDLKKPAITNKIVNAKQQHDSSSEETNEEK